MNLYIDSMKSFDEVVLTTLLRSAPIGFAFLDRDLRFVMVNDRLAEINGVPAEAHPGRHVSEIVPALASAITELTRGIAESGEPVLDHEFSGDTRAAPGVQRWWRESWYPVRSADGELAGFGAMVEDITERKRAEEQLKRNADTFYRLIQNNPFGVYVVDADFRLREVSLGAQKVFCNVRPLLGRDFAEVLRMIWTDPFASEAIRRFRHTLETGEPYSAPSTVEKRQDIGEVEAYDWRIERIALPDGRFGVVCYFYDLSERQRWEEALRESEERFRLLVESAAQAVWETDAAGSVVSDSPSWRSYTGQTLQEWLGNEWAGALHPDDREHVEALWRSAVRTRTRLDAEFRLRHAAGGWCWTNMHAAPLLNSDGTVRKWVGMNIDITERKRAEAERERVAEALREADRRKDEFLATLAHELRNPLAPIRNGLHIVSLSTNADSPLQRTVEMMDRQLNHLVRLVDDLLDVGRISSGKVELRRDRVGLREVLASSIEASQALIEARRHELVVEEGQEELFVDGDFDRLSQVFSNLLSNAAKYTDAGGRITLRTRMDRGEAVVEVNDTGIGIPSADLVHVFDLFSQVRLHQGRAEGGLGIGLALVRRLVAMHGGRVTVHSRGPGAGSTFTVRLPMAHANAVDARDDMSAASAAAAPVRRLRILVADDNRDAAASLAQLLEMQGHDVAVTHDGLQALEKAQTVRPEVVFLDLGMPRMDGFETARRLRTLPGGETMLLVALTGWGKDKDREQTRMAGFDHHLVKPVDHALLAETLRRFDSGEGYGA